MIDYYKFSKKDDSNIVLLPVFCDDEWFNDCHWMLLEITPKLRDFFIKANNAAINTKKFFEAEFFAIEFLCRDFEMLHDNQVNHDADNEDVIVGVADWHEDEIAGVTYEKTMIGDDKAEDLRTEAHIAKFDGVSVKFSCWLKNTSIHLYTSWTSVNQLLNIEP